MVADNERPPSQLFNGVGSKLPAKLAAFAQAALQTTDGSPITQSFFRAPMVVAFKGRLRHPILATRIEDMRIGSDRILQSTLLYKSPVRHVCHVEHWPSNDGE